MEDPAKYKTKVPRRNRLDLNTKAEKAIYEAMQEVERLPADVKLTEAVILLARAKELVSDFVDSQPTGDGYLTRPGHAELTR